jgi:hypothetical protein
LPTELARVSSGEIFKADLTPAKSYECRKLSSFVQTNKQDLLTAIEVLLANLAMQVNVKYNIEPHQATDIGQTIYRNYYFYSLEEVALVLRMGSEGRLYDEKGFGKMYDRLSKDIIMNWFLIYDQRHREPLVNNFRQKMNNEYEEGQVEISTVFSDAIGKIIDRMKSEEEQEKHKEENYSAWRKKYFENKNETK